MKDNEIPLTPEELQTFDAARAEWEQEHNRTMDVFEKMLLCIRLGFVKEKATPCAAQDSK